MNAGIVGLLAGIGLVLLALGLVFSTGGLALPIIALLLGLGLLVVGGRSLRAARTPGAEADPGTSASAPGEPLRDQASAVFVGTGLPSDPLRSDSG